MTISPQELKLSAKACGLLDVRTAGGVTSYVYGGFYSGPSTTTITGVRREWNPAENAEQDRICRDELLRRGWDIRILTLGMHRIVSSDGHKSFDCHPNELCAKALARLEEEK